MRQGMQVVAERAGWVAYLADEEAGMEEEAVMEGHSAG
jgi:hypothetical protein